MFHGYIHIFLIETNGFSMLRITFPVIKWKFYILPMQYYSFHQSRDVTCIDFQNEPRRNIIKIYNIHYDNHNIILPRIKWILRNKYN